MNVSVTAGVDCGARTVKAVVLRDGAVLARASAPTGADVAAAARGALDACLERAGLASEQLERVVTTGAGRQAAGLEARTESEELTAARGMAHLDPQVRTVIDVGAEDARAVRVDARGRVVEALVNERCAAGAGAFAESMARALEVELEELGRLALEGGGPVALNAQCVVFAESEVVRLIHGRTPRADIARAIHDAIAERTASLVRRVGLEGRVALVGGVARSLGFVRALARELATDVHVPDAPEYVGALGAALLAAGGDDG